MTADTIRVKPSAGLLRPFAEWAVAQVPKVRTVTSNAFAVPAALFPEVPEDVLVGALVDGRPYIPRAEAAGEQPAEAPGQGVDAGGAPAGGDGPAETPAAADTTSPDFTPLDDAPAEDTAKPAPSRRSRSAAKKGTRNGS